MTSVKATRFVACPFSATIEFAQDAIEQRTDIRLSPAPLSGEHVDVAVKTSEDLSDLARRHDALLISWQPRHGALFPNFHGALTVRPKQRGSWMRLQGSYEPPMGFPGRLFDALFGRLIAALTFRRLLREIGASVESTWNAFRKEIPRG